MNPQNIFFFLCHSLYHPVSNYQICTKFLFWCHKSKREGDMLFLLFLFCDNNKKKKFGIWYLVFSHRLVQWKKHLFSLERIQNLGHCELFGVHIRWVMDIFVAGNFSILFVCRPVCLPVHSGFFFILINNLQERRTQVISTFVLKFELIFRRFSQKD